MMPSLFRSARAALLALLVAPPVGAQTLTGRIVDSESGQPVTLAYVALLAEGGNLVVASLASDSGGFELRAPGAGAYFVYAARAGYETLMDGVFDLGEGGVLELQVGLKPSPVALEPLTVEAERMESPLELVGFYDRAAVGIGHFMIREDIERVAVDRVSDVFRTVPRLGVITSRPLIGSPEVMRSPELVVRRPDGPCYPTLYIDHNLIASGVLQPVRPDDYVSPGEVEAIEVYTSEAEVPPQFNSINRCGVVLIWTRMR